MGLFNSFKKLWEQPLGSQPEETAIDATKVEVVDTPEWVEDDEGIEALADSLVELAKLVVGSKESDTGEASSQEEPEKTDAGESSDQEEPEEIEEPEEPAKVKKAEETPETPKAAQSNQPKASKTPKKPENGQNSGKTDAGKAQNPAQTGKNSAKKPQSGQSGQKTNSGKAGTGKKSDAPTEPKAGQKKPDASKKSNQTKNADKGKSQKAQKTQKAEKAKEKPTLQAPKPLAEMEAKPLEHLPEGEDPVGEQKIMRVFILPKKGKGGKLVCYDAPNMAVYSTKELSEGRRTKAWQWGALVDAKGRIVYAAPPLETSPKLRRQIISVVRGAQQEDAKNGVGLPVGLDLLDTFDQKGEKILVGAFPTFAKERKGEKKISPEQRVQEARSALLKFQEKYADIIRRRDEFLKDRDLAIEGQKFMTQDMEIQIAVGLSGELFELYGKTETLYNGVEAVLPDLEKSSLTEEERKQFLEMLEEIKEFSQIPKNELQTSFFPKEFFDSLAPEAEGESDPESTEGESEDSEGGDGEESEGEDSEPTEVEEDSEEGEETGEPEPESVQEEPEDGENAENGADEPGNDPEIVSVQEFDADGFGAFDGGLTQEEIEDLLAGATPDPDDSGATGVTSGQEQPDEEPENELEPGVTPDPDVPEVPDNLQGLTQEEIVEILAGRAKPEDFVEKAEDPAESVLQPEPQPAPQEKKSKAAQVLDAITGPNRGSESNSESTTPSLNDFQAMMEALTANFANIISGNLKGIDMYVENNVKQTEVMMNMYQKQTAQVADIYERINQIPEMNSEALEQKLQEQSERQQEQMRETLQGATISLSGGLSDEACQQIGEQVQQANAEIEKEIKNAVGKGLRQTREGIDNNIGRHMKALDQQLGARFKGQNQYLENLGAKLESIETLGAQIGDIHAMMTSGFGWHADDPGRESLPDPYDQAATKLAMAVGSDNLEKLNRLPSEKVKELISWAIENADEES